MGGGGTESVSLQFAVYRERERERELEQSVRRQAAKESGNLLLLFVVVAYFSPSCV